MNQIFVHTCTPEEVVSTVLRRLNQQRIDAATASFAKDFRFTDHGIGLEFTDTGRLAEFFGKTRELYPDYTLHADQVFVNGDHVIMQWTLHVTMTEPFYGGPSREVPLSLAGVSIVRIADGKVVDWADYYDGLTSRRTALAAHFTE